MKLSQSEQRLLVYVQEARKSRQKILPQAEALGVDLDGAYRIQALLGEKRKLRGYKLGVTSPAKQAQMGIKSPTYGRVYSEMLLNRPVHLNQFIQPRIEPELAVVMRDDLPAHVSPEAARLAVGGIFLGVDFLDSIWEGYRFSIAVYEPNTWRVCTIKLGHIGLRGAFSRLASLVNWRCILSHLISLCRTRSNEQDFSYKMARIYRKPLLEQRDFMQA